MFIKAILSNKKILIGGGILVIAAAILIGGTVAYFSDTETSVGNTFKAGKLNLLIDNTCHYNGKVCANGKWGETQEPCACTWSLKDLAGELYFNLLDVKPGDSGEDTISLHVINNPAWICAEIANLLNAENGCDSPENKIDATCGTNEGELQQNLFFSIWKDDGIGGGVACNNIKDGEETYIIQNQPAQAGTWPIADSQHGSAIPGGNTICYGVKWNVPIETSNIIQSDSLVGDVKFTAVQSRNMDTFKCSDLTGGEIGPTCTPTTETCNGLDDDCDGTIDEGDAGGGGACTTGLQGICSAGTLHCVSGALSCVQNIVSSPETCDGLDNDCDGQVDEGNPGGGNACTTGQQGICSAGTTQCVAGAISCVQNHQSTSEACDGTDNDCDGQVDEGGVCVAESNCHDGIDNNQDGHIDCTDAGCYFGSTDCQLNVCGNHVCESGETYVNCSTDCPAPQCTSNAQCEDGKSCTDDTCVLGMCVHTPFNNRCMSALDSCVTGICSVAGGGDIYGCIYQPSSAVGTSCWNLTCMMTGGCSGWTCSAGGYCAYSGSSGACSTDANCNDNDACTIDVCSSNTCQHTNVVTSQCAPWGGTCTNGNVTCNSNPNCPNNCDDGNACTLDTCELTGCTHTGGNTLNCNGAAFEVCNPSSGVHTCVCILGGASYPSCSLNIDWNPFD